MLPVSKRYHIDFEKPVVEMEHRLDLLKQDPLADQPDIHEEIEELERQIEKLKLRTYSNLSAWQKVQMSRHPDRPRFSTYLDLAFQDWHELHGDRAFRDDAAVVGGLATICERRIVLVGQEKGANTRERVHRNFGMPHPEGYRKATRLFNLAGKFGLPLVTFIDTQGAYAGVGAEERGQARAIAECLRVLSDLPVPIIAVVIGEGGSGGALAFGVADHVIMLEHSYYSVITPEGCSAILWQTKENAPEAAETLSLTAENLLEMGIIDTVIPEPLGGAHRDGESVARRVRDELAAKLRELSGRSADDLVQKRYERFRRVGVFSE